MSKGAYLCVGHVCMDVSTEGFTLGGTSSYSALLANALGYQSSVLTSFGDNFEFVKNFENVEMHVIPSAKTTIFDNRYAGDERAQILNAKAADLTTQDFQNLDGQFEIIHFCPIAQELDFDMIQNVEEGALTIATPQGWLRKWDRDGKVTFQNLDWQNLKGIDFVIISEEDVPELERRLSEIRKYIDKLIVTKGGSGATIYFGDEVLDFPAFTTKVVDPTGAGDSFATGFITRYAQTKDLRESMIYANCLSSLCIENVGTLFFDRIDEVDNRIYEYKRRYTTI